MNEVSLFNFIPGRLMEIPQPRSGHPQVLDAEIAYYFYHSTHFYAATIQKIEEALLALDRELRRPEWRHLLEGMELPPLRGDG